MKLSVVVPAYNESKNIENALLKIKEHLEKINQDFEIIVIDDGSKDNTIELVTKFIEICPKVSLLINQRNRGKGYSIKRGMLKASGYFILFSDADLATPIEEIDKMIPFINEYDILLGSRRIKGSKIIHNQPLIRIIAGHIFHSLVSTLIIKNIKDTQCGFKMYKTDIAQKIARNQQTERFAFDVEHLFLASKLNYKIKEVPVKWIDDADSRLNVATDSIQMLKDILKIKINHIFGKYKF
jgi:dolichyl-phosphate beta-glucosyltransferase